MRDRSVGPGLVDVHCHGAMGSDFADGTLEDIARAARYHLSRGTTTLLAGIGSCSTAEMLRACASVRELMATLPNLAGVHLEGPCFSRERYGCHQESMIRDPTLEEWCQFEPWRDVVRWCTLAPELPGALDFIRGFAAGTVFAVGHSTATYERTVACRGGTKTRSSTSMKMLRLGQHDPRRPSVTARIPPWARRDWGK